jgi:preprotein translocase subunit SecE
MNLINYLKETKEELKHVSWPTQKQITTFTILVIIISVFIALFLGFFDAVFVRLLEYII